MSNCTTLLPPNATPQERAIECTTSRIGEVSVPLRSLWDPDTCPAKFLPWLAWALSVDTWRSDWPEATKRAAIKASHAIHSRKGTAYAVRSAVAVVNTEAEVVEWFQNNRAPYTFEINLDVTDTGIENAQSLDRLRDTALSAKNVRSHLTAVNAIIVEKNPFYIGAAFTDQVVAQSLPFPAVIESRPN